MINYGEANKIGHAGYDMMKEGLECASVALDALPPTELAWSPLTLYHTHVGGSNLHLRLHCHLLMQDMSERHGEVWSSLCSLLDCNGKGPTDCAANMLFALVILFTVDEKDAELLENPEVVEKARKKHENMLGKYLKLTYSQELASAKLAALGRYVKNAREFYEIHRRRVFTD